MKNKTLTDIQIKAARMLAMGHQVNDVAKEAGVTRVTVFRWRKLPQFAAEVSRLLDAAKEESKEIIVKDIAEVKDVVLSTLLDVAKYDSSGSARVSAARALMEMVEKAEERTAPGDVMQDQSAEIKNLLELIHQEQAHQSLA